MHAAMDLASARFISLGTWKWAELQSKTSGAPVYRYLYTRIRPKYLGMPGQPPPAARSDQPQPAPLGASHSAEIQYAMGNLDLDKRYTWESEDYKVSEILQSYFVNFIKTGNPNGRGLPEWPQYGAKTDYARMRIDVTAKPEPDSDRTRYLVLEAIAAKRQ
jgi:para-nitrobenzyl esterase